jgi:hypothetical protein
VPHALERLAQEHNAEDHDGRGKPYGDESCLGLEAAVVALHVDLGDEVESPVADELAEDGGHHGSKVVKGW